ncbi:MAG: FixH family protein [Saprospiraceae bacterium]|nr:FixH family protein [Saprospiraceae bacterium]MCB9324488.1 FixH family protein [Lewinellaceae bacterium]
MKWNWGTGIAVFYTSFALFMVFMVIRSTFYDHSLVVEDYYAKDLAYQEQYDKIKNSQELEEGLVIKNNAAERTVELIFPQGIKDIKGQVQFYRPSDKANDFYVKIDNPENGKMLIPVGNAISGYWIVKVDWQGDGKAFYDEKNIRVN